jgi:hypothetical protein
LWEQKRWQDNEEGTPYMKGVLIARAELLELPSSSPSEVLYEDNNFLCQKCTEYSSVPFL